MEIEYYEDMPTDRIPLKNGWFAVDLGDGLYEIFDSNGTPLGFIQLKPGENIEDFDDWDRLVPLIPFPDEKEPEPPKKIPQTGDILMIAIFMLIAAVLGIAVAVRKKAKNVK